MKNTMLEMVTRTFQFYLNDQNGDLVTFLETDTWTLEVSVVNGSGGLGSNGLDVCTFMVSGLCDINFSLDTSADGYALRFIVRNSNGTIVDTIAPYDIDSINIGPRPLDIIFKEHPYLVVPKGISFSIIVSLWDVALKTIADPSINLPGDINCSLSLTGNNTNLTGISSLIIDSSSK